MKQEKDYESQALLSEAERAHLEEAADILRRCERHNRSEEHLTLESMNRLMHTELYDWYERDQSAKPPPQSPSEATSAEQPTAQRAISLDDLGGAAEALFDMLHLYSGYNVLSRGPIGLIHKALKVLHPEAQAMLAEGAEVSEVRDRFWPTDENGDPIEPADRTPAPSETNTCGKRRIPHSGATHVCNLPADHLSDCVWTALPAPSEAEPFVTLTELTRALKAVRQASFTGQTYPFELLVAELERSKG
jgi:hypothetical protein